MVKQEIKDAIILLTENGYRVEKITTPIIVNQRIPISLLEISERYVISCEKNSIHTVLELISKSEKELLTFMGKRGVCEIKDALYKVGLCLKIK